MERGYWIKSKPDYGTIAIKSPAQSHLIIAAGGGGLAVLQALQQRYPTEPLHVIYISDGAEGNDYSGPINMIAGDDCSICLTPPEAMQQFDLALGRAGMGCKIYVAGSEHFIWQAVDAAVRYGVHEADIGKQLVGTLARPVYCTHCKNLLPSVTTDIVPCPNCGRHLFVRDHFSRRLGAYMGLMIDAETPGKVPATKEIYP